MSEATPFGIYLHIPYCKAKCRYCDFYSAPGARGVPQSYVDALLRELAKIDGVVTKVAASVESLEKNEPYLVVQGSGGVMVQGTVSEMNLDKLTVGATVTVNSWDTGEMLTAEVTEIDKTPTSYTNQNGSENPNNSAYPFKAAVTDSTSLSVGSYVSLSFSGAADDVSDTFYLPVSYVRQENGQYYVLRESKDKKLERQNVQTGKIINGGYAIEILSGVSQEDYLFPLWQVCRRGSVGQRNQRLIRILRGTYYAGKYSVIVTGHFVP